MKSIAVMLMIFTAVTGSAEIFHKKDAAAMKQIQYRRVMAIEEIKILEKYVQCLNNADRTESMDKCTKIREKAVNNLFRESGDIKKEVGRKTKS